MSSGKEIAATSPPQQQPDEEEELEDPLDKLREQCREKPDCRKFLEKLNTCNDRVNSKTKTSETCLEEVIDYFHCVDHCAGKNLFKFLK